MNIVKLNQNFLKAVEYFDNTIMVPDYVAYIATDVDGDINGFSHLPLLDEDKYWYRSDDTELRVFIGVADGGFLCASETLVKVG